jgi:predicted transcriptional regulator
LDDEILDLLGDPIPEGHGRRGRPPHIPTKKNRQKIMMLLALEKSDDDIAHALGITDKTLRKHYFRELEARRAARLRLEGALLGALASEAATGSVAANKEIDKRLQRHDLAKLATRVADRGRSEERQEPKGKKEVATEKAHAVGGKFAPPPAPRLIN